MYTIQTNPHRQPVLSSLWNVAGTSELKGGLPCSWAPGPAFAVATLAPLPVRSLLPSPAVRRSGAAWS
jgi:hypothetical protein